jgi:hypothetical protein
MLSNNSDFSNTFLSILEWILTTPEFNFELTGSRAFGNACRSSDYDFFTLQSHFLEERLLGFGFFLMETSNYKDSSVAKVFRYASQNGVIDIQIIINELTFEKKKKVNDALKAYPDVIGILHESKHGSKDSYITSYFWDLLLSIA